MAWREKPTIHLVSHFCASPFLPRWWGLLTCSSPSTCCFFTFLLRWPVVWCLRRATHVLNPLIVCHVGVGYCIAIDVAHEKNQRLHDHGGDPSVYNLCIRLGYGKANKGWIYYAKPNQIAASLPKEKTLFAHLALWINVKLTPCFLLLFFL